VFGVDFHQLTRHRVKQFCRLDDARTSDDGCFLIHFALQNYAISLNPPKKYAKNFVIP
jgi:hypothetical protein